MVSKISSILNQTFLETTTWYSPFGEAGAIDKEALENSLESTLADIIDLFIESILIGEYEITVDFDDSFTTLLKESSSIYDNLVTEMVEDTVLLNSTEDFIKGIKVLILHYRNFYKVLSIHKSSPNFDLVFSSSPNNSALFDDSTFSKETIAGFLNFFRTLQLNRLDHFFDEGTDFFSTLIELENLINKSKFEFKHVRALQLKISFLKYKWVIRQNTTYKNIDGQFSVKSYLIDNELISVLETPALNSTNPKLNEWKDYLEFHYEYNGKDYYLKKYNDLKLKDLNLLNFNELHFLIKYHKDIKKDYKNLSEVVGEIESRESQYSLNKSLFFKNLNYALNNQFSLLIADESAKENDVIELREKIKKMQNKAGNDNFFLEYKYLKYCVNRFKMLIENREAFDTKMPVKKYLKEIRELFSECEKKIIWSEYHHNLLYQLPYEESLVPYNFDELENIYFASSFLLPLSVEQANNDIQKIKIDFNNEFNHTEVYNSLDKEFNQIKSLKSSVAEGEKKSIETITIFTAIISFIVGSISGFKFIDSFYTAIIFLLIFSTSLFSFVLLIFLSTKGIEKIYQHKKAIIWLYSLISVLTLIVFYFKGKNDAKEFLNDKKTVNIEIKRRIDSLAHDYDKKLIKIKADLNPEKKEIQEVKSKAKK